MTSADPILDNVRAVAELEQQAIHSRTRFERFTDAISEAAGSVAFIVVHITWFAVWITVNLTGRPFDHPPFGLLNLILSLEAIVLTSFVLMTQNRMTRHADKRAHLDLQINLLAEQELTATLHMLHALCRQAGVRVTVRDARVEELLKETDIQQLVGTLDQELKQRSS